MKITFNHITGFGKVTDMDLICSDPYGEIEIGDNIDDLLDNGWIPWGSRWYNIRSVRIDVEKHKPSRKTNKQKKKVDCVINKISDIEKIKSNINDIYTKYLYKKKFNDRIGLDQIISHSSHYLQFIFNGVPIGYTFYKEFPQSFVSFQFMTGFDNGNMSLGSISQYYECYLANLQNKKYVYILGGYEKECIYKSKYYGMEWWTGNNWSNDIDLYQRLCERDSQIEIKNYDNI